MQSERSGRRSYGTGSLFEAHGAWYGQWRRGGRLVKRKVGTKRATGTRDGLTRTQAEARLRRLIDETRVAPTPVRLSFGEVAERYLGHLEHVMERKPSTVQDYRLMLNRHLAPFLDGKGVERITPDDLAAYMAVKAQEGLATKTVSNHLNFAHGVFRYAVKRGWATSNPVAAVDRPRATGADPDIRFLDRDELEALLRAVPDDELGAVEGPLYLMAATTGLRQGELVALRWLDVDWTASVVRVRRSFTRGRWGTPSSDGVEYPDTVMGQLGDRMNDSELVISRPSAGKVLSAHGLRGVPSDEVGDRLLKLIEAGALTDQELDVLVDAGILSRGAAT